MFSPAKQRIPPSTYFWFVCCYLDDEEGDGRGDGCTNIQGADGGTMGVKEVPHLDERESNAQPQLRKSGQDSARFWITSL